MTTETNIEVIQMSALTEKVTLYSRRQKKVCFCCINVCVSYRKDQMEIIKYYTQIYNSLKK